MVQSMVPKSVWIVSVPICLPDPSYFTSLMKSDADIQSVSSSPFSLTRTWSPSTLTTVYVSLSRSSSSYLTYWM